MLQEETEAQMKEFKTYHPIVNFVYFVFMIGFSCFFMHPVCLGLSLFCGFTYSVMQKGRKGVKTNLIYILPTMLLMAVMNPLFSHSGATILTYLPDGNPLTLESIVYGVGSGMMVASVILWFSAYNEVMTSDKFIYLFGKIIPSLSLIISMTLRFVPKFTTQLRVVVNAQKCLGRDISQGSIVKRMKCAVTILSIMITWSLENAIETADSMKARGYGLKGRTAFSIFRFDKRDTTAFLCIVLLGLYTLVGYYFGGMYFNYFPTLKWGEVSPFNISVFISYGLMCLCPVIIEVKEARRWSALISKI